MDPRDFIKSFFGFPRQNHGQSNFPTSDDDNEMEGVPPRFGGEDRDEPYGDNFFQVFTNPLDMERFFNHQMESMLKNFGFNSGFFSFPNEFMDKPGALPGPRPGMGGSLDSSDPGSRDFMLKEGSKRSATVLKPGDNDFKDETVEGITSGDLDELYKDSDSHSRSDVFGGFFGPSFGPVSPFGRLPFSLPDQNEDRIGEGRFSTFSFGQSFSQRTVVKPDGSIEEHRCVRDSNGNETTTITRTINGKSETTTSTRKVGELRGPLDDDSPRDRMLKPVPERDQLVYKSLFSKFFGH